MAVDEDPPVSSAGPTPCRIAGKQGVATGSDASGSRSSSSAVSHRSRRKPDRANVAAITGLSTTSLGSKQLRADVVNHGLKPVQRNLLDIDSTHAGAGVSRDSMNRVLVMHLIGPRSEGVAKAVEPNARTSDLESIEHLGESQGNLVSVTNSQRPIFVLPNRLSHHRIAARS